MLGLVSERLAEPGSEGSPSIELEDNGGSVTGGVGGVLGFSSGGGAVDSIGSDSEEGATAELGASVAGLAGGSARVDSPLVGGDSVSEGKIATSMTDSGSGGGSIAS